MTREAELIEGGTQHLKAGRFNDAISVFTNAIRINRGDFKAYLGRGMAYYLIKDYRKAVEDFSVAIELEPSEPNLYANRANAYTRQQYYQKAIADHTEVLRLRPKDPTSLAARGIVYAMLGDTGNALIDMNEAIELESRTEALAYCLRSRAEIYDQMGDRARATADRAREEELTHPKPAQSQSGCLLTLVALATGGSLVFVWL